MPGEDRGKLAQVSLLRSMVCQLKNLFLPLNFLQKVSDKISKPISPLKLTNITTVVIMMIAWCQLQQQDLASQGLWREIVTGWPRTRTPWPTLTRTLRSRVCPREKVFTPPAASFTSLCSLHRQHLLLWYNPASYYTLYNSCFYEEPWWFPTFPNSPKFCLKRFRALLCLWHPQNMKTFTRL